MSAHQTMQAPRQGNPTGLSLDGVSFVNAQTLSSLRLSDSIAFSDANRNVAENVPRLILFAIEASVSFNPCFSSRSASSRYPTSARASSAFRKRFARSSQEGGLGLAVDGYARSDRNRPGAGTECPKSTGVRTATPTAKRTYCEYRTDRVHCCLRHCQGIKTRTATRNRRGAGKQGTASVVGSPLWACRIPVIRSTTNECSASSRRRIVHG